MRQLVVTRRARLDIDDILAQSEARFGPMAAERYRRLLDQGLADLQQEPQRPSARRRKGGPEGVRFYHMLSVGRSLPVADRIARPRHLIAFSFNAAEVRILRVLHERMDVERRLSGD